MNWGLVMIKHRAAVCIFKNAKVLLPQIPFQVELRFLNQIVGYFRSHKMIGDNNIMIYANAPIEIRAQE